MKNKSNYLIAVLIVTNIICLILIVIQNRTIDNLEMNTVSLAPGISLPPLDLSPINQPTEAESKKIKLIFIFKSPCSACNANLSAWKRLAGYFEKKIDTLGIVLDGNFEAQRLMDDASVDFKLYVPEDVDRFKEKMHIKLNMAQTIIVLDNKVIYVRLGTLKHTDIEGILKTIKETLKSA